MLQGIDPLLTGELLVHLDQMGHGDLIVIADAHFPARSLATRFVDMPGVATPDLVRAVRTVLPLDGAPAVLAMATPDDSTLPIHEALADAAGITVAAVEFVERFAFYDLAKSAYVIVRTGENRIYANAALRKGVVG